MQSLRLFWWVLHGVRGPGNTIRSLRALCRGQFRFHYSCCFFRCLFHVNHSTRFVPEREIWCYDAAIATVTHKAGCCTTFERILFICYLCLSQYYSSKFCWHATRCLRLMSVYMAAILSINTDTYSLKFTLLVFWECTHCDTHFMKRVFNTSFFSMAMPLYLVISWMPHTHIYSHVICQ